MERHGEWKWGNRERVRITMSQFNSFIFLNPSISENPLPFYLSEMLTTLGSESGILTSGEDGGKWKEHLGECNEESKSGEATDEVDDVGFCWNWWKRCLSSPTFIYKADRGKHKHKLPHFSQILSYFHVDCIRLDPFVLLPPPPACLSTVYILFNFRCGIL